MTIPDNSAEVVARLRRGPLEYTSGCTPVYGGPSLLDTEAANLVENLRQRLAEAEGERDRAVRKERDMAIRYNTWKQYYGALITTMGDTPEQAKIKRQARIIDHQAYKIKNQRTAIKHMNAERRDPLAPGGLPGYNVYRHCAKLRELWLAAEARLKAIAAEPSK